MFKRDDRLFDSDEDRDDRENLERVHARAEDLFGGRAGRVAALVATLAVLYWLYLYWFIRMPNADTMTFSGVIGRTLLIALVAGLPFLAMAWLDPSWRSRHAATIAVSTWLAVFVLFAVKYNAECPKVAIFLFIPLTFGALIGHNVGMFRHPETFDPDD